MAKIIDIGEAVATSESIRSAAIAVLGGKCRECGIADDRVLIITNEDSSAAAARKAKMNREKYYLSIIREYRQAGDGSGWFLLCANDNMIRTAELFTAAGERRKAEKAAREAMTTTPQHPIIVWRSHLPAEETFCKHGWLEQYVTNGYDAYIIWEGAVYRLGGKEPLGPWAAVAKMIGVAIEEPTEMVTRFEQGRVAA